MITLLPALLVIFGRWIFWPQRPTFGTPEPTSTGFWATVGTPDRAASARGLGRHGRRPGGRAASASCSSTPTACRPQDAYTKEFDSVDRPAGADRPRAGRHRPARCMVVANADQAARRRAGDARASRASASPSPPIVKDGVALISAPLDVRPDVQGRVRDRRRRARTAVHAVAGRRRARRRGVGDQRSTSRRRRARDNRVIIPLVLLVVMLVLMVLLRAVLSPLILIAHRGAVLRRRPGHQRAAVPARLRASPGPTPSLPLFVFVFLVALGIDYNIFLMTRVREETPEHGTRRASLIALGATGGVITSAGLVLAATFAVLGDAAAGGVRRDRDRGRARRAARHDDRAVGAGHRDQPRRRRQDLVAEQARPRRRADSGRGGRTRSRRSTADRRAGNHRRPSSPGDGALAVGAGSAGQRCRRTGTDSTPYTIDLAW